MKVKPMLALSIIFILSLLAGCSAKQESKEAKAYLDKVASYTGAVNDYSKRTTAVLSSNQSAESKSANILTETQKMRQKIKTFNELTPPRALRHVHRKIVAQNYLLDDSLYLVESGIKAGKVSSATLDKYSEKIKASETTKNIGKVVKSFSK